MPTPDADGCGSRCSFAAVHWMSPTARRSGFLECQVRSQAAPHNGGDSGRIRAAKFASLSNKLNPKRSEPLITIDGKDNATARAARPAKGFGKDAGKVSAAFLM